MARDTTRTAAQQHVLTRMHEGWELAEVITLRRQQPVYLWQQGAGQAGDRERVARRTVEALVRTGAIRRTKDARWFVRAYEVVTPAAPDTQDGPEPVHKRSPVCSNAS
jgi:hypothetical protein